MNVGITGCRSSKGNAQGENRAQPRWGDGNFWEKTRTKLKGARPALAVALACVAGIASSSVQCQEPAGQAQATVPGEVRGMSFEVFGKKLLTLGGNEAQLNFAQEDISGIVKTIMGEITDSNKSIADNPEFADALGGEVGNLLKALSNIYSPQPITQIMQHGTYIFPGTSVYGFYNGGTPTLDTDNLKAFFDQFEGFKYNRAPKDKPEDTLKKLNALAENTLFMNINYAIGDMGKIEGRYGLLTGKGNAVLSFGGESEPIFSTLLYDTGSDTLHFDKFQLGGQNAKLSLVSKPMLKDPSGKDIPWLAGTSLFDWNRFDMQLEWGGAKWYYRPNKGSFEGLMNLGGKYMGAELSLSQGTLDTGAVVNRYAVKFSEGPFANTNLIWQNDRFFGTVQTTAGPANLIATQDPNGLYNLQASFQEGAFAGLTLDYKGDETGSGGMFYGTMSKGFGDVQIAASFKPSTPTASTPIISFQATVSNSFFSGLTFDYDQANQRWAGTLKFAGQDMNAVLSASADLATGQRDTLELSLPKVSQGAPVLVASFLEGVLDRVALNYGTQQYIITGGYGGSRAPMSPPSLYTILNQVEPLLGQKPTAAPVLPQNPPQIPLSYWISFMNTALPIDVKEVTLFMSESLGIEAAKFSLAGQTAKLNFALGKQGTIEQGVLATLDFNGTQLTWDDQQKKFTGAGLFTISQFGKIGGTLSIGRNSQMSTGLVFESEDGKIKARGYVLELPDGQEAIMWEVNANIRIGKSDKTAIILQGMQTPEGYPEFRGTLELAF